MKLTKCLLMFRGPEGHNRGLLPVAMIVPVPINIRLSLLRDKEETNYGYKYENF